MVRLDELKSKVMQIIKEINQDWVTALKEADKNNEPLDMSEGYARFTAKMQELDKAFIEAKQRLNNKKGKKGWF